MCGIAGGIGVDVPRVRNAIRVIRHRGPDAQRVWSTVSRDDVVTLGHARLSVIDLSTAANQPMVSSSGDVALVFNGEIYNYREIREQLIARGHSFVTQSDTEVILVGYQEFGIQIVNRLRGMFAFSLWDGRTRELFVARDRLGIKPLFVADVAPGRLLFASEIKALLAMGHPPEVEPATLREFLQLLYVPPPGTAFQGIAELLPGHILTWRDGRTSIDCYWTVPRAHDGASMDYPEIVARTRATLETAVSQHTIADVPVGAFLSGGLDSSTIVALMARASSHPIRTFTMTFGEGEERYDEREYARVVAERFGTRHTEIPVRPDVTQLVERVVEHFDQPFGNPTALLSYELSRLTRDHVTVALAGDGGDEAFLGYPRYAGMRLASAYVRVPRVVRERVARWGDAVLTDSTRGEHRWRRAREFLASGAKNPDAMYADWVGYFSGDEIDAIDLSTGSSVRADQYIHRLMEARSDRSPADRAAAVDLASFLPNNVLAYGDRMSMAHALELRVPLCDHVLVEELASLPVGVRMKGLTGKRILRDIAKDLLPDRVLNRPKLGFNPPLAMWINGPLKPMIDEYLSEDTIRRRGVFDARGVRRLVDEHRAGRRDRSLHIWALLVFEIWRDRVLSRSYADEGFEDHR